MENHPTDPPWSIPVREPGPDIPQRSATWVDRLPVLPVAVAAVALFLLVVGAVVVLGESPSAPGGEVLGAEVLGDQVTAPSTASTVDDASTTASTDGETVATTTPAPTTTAAPSTTAPAPATRPSGAAPAPEPSGLPIHTPDDLGDGWVAQVSSVPTSAGGNALARAFETVQTTVPDAIVLRGSEWAPLREGFWVIVAPGFDSAAEAVGGCDESGRTGRDQCFARYLTADDETQLTCWREASGELAGACS